MSKYEHITTHDIRKGDIVWSDGMRLQIVTEPRVTNHPVNEYSPTLAATAVITNWDAVKGYVGNLAEVDAEGNRTWVVQGNGLRQLSREVQEPVHPFAAWGEHADEVARYMATTNQAQFGD